MAAAFALLALLLAFGLDEAAAVAALSCICCSSDLTDIAVLCASVFSVCVRSCVRHRDALKQAVSVEGTVHTTSK